MRRKSEYGTLFGSLMSIAHGVFFRTCYVLDEPISFRASYLWRKVNLLNLERRNLVDRVEPSAVPLLSLEPECKVR